jgi:hypothetical protein
MEWDDNRWLELNGGYGTPYDPRGAIRKLANGDVAAAWEELWQELYHQGDVGEVSYAAISKLVDEHEARGARDWNTYAFAATVEVARQNPKNPTLPSWLASDYEAAWHKLQVMALAELPTANTDELIDSIIAVLAFGKKRATLGRMAMLAEDERMELLEGAGWG